MSERHDDGWTDSDRECEIERVEANLKVEEIFEQGFTFGHSRAGLHSRSDVAFKDWLDNRLEARARR